MNRIPFFCTQRAVDLRLSAVHSKSGIVHFSSLLAVLVFLCAVGCAFAQESPAKKGSAQAASLHGTVSTTQDNSLAGLAGVSVKLTREGASEAPLAATTDENGRYEFKNLELVASIFVRGCSERRLR